MIELNIALSIYINLSSTVRIKAPLHSSPKTDAGRQNHTYVAMRPPALINRGRCHIGPEVLCDLITHLRERAQKLRRACGDLEY